MSGLKPIEFLCVFYFEGMKLNIWKSDNSASPKLFLLIRLLIQKLRSKLFGILCTTLPKAFFLKKHHEAKNRDQKGSKNELKNEEQHCNIRKVKKWEE